MNVTSPDASENPFEKERHFSCAGRATRGSSCKCLEKRSS